MQHGYSTRKTNKDSRPAFAVGLAKRYKVDIINEANAKKAVEDAARAQKKADQEAAAAALDLKRDAVVILERQRAEDDVEEARYFSTSVPTPEHTLRAACSDTYSLYGRYGPPTWRSI